MGPAPWVLRCPGQPASGFVNGLTQLFNRLGLQRIAAMKAKNKEKLSANSLPSDPGKAD